MLYRLLKSDSAAIAVATLFGLILFLLSMDFTPLRDDFFHREIVLRSNSLLHTLNHLFSFTDVYSIEQLRASGQIPWWTSDQLALNFWRPMSAFTHWLDYQLWPHSWLLMHLHSLLWFALVCGLLGCFLRSVDCHGPLLWLVMLLFALDANHYVTVSWLANRNVLVASVFGLLTLISLRHWQCEKKPQLLFLSGLCFGLALLAAEAGIAFLGFVMALVWLLGSQTRLQRVSVTLGFVLITLGWRLLYQQLGYGVQHSGMYLDPIADTGAFLPQLLVTGSTLLVEQFFRVPTFAIVMSPQTLDLQVILNLLLLTLLALLLWPLLKRRRLVQFGLMAGTLGLIPLCASVLVDVRLLFIPSLGFWLFMAVWFYDTFTKPAKHHKSKIYGYVRLGMTVLLFFVVLVVNWKSWSYRLAAESNQDPFQATMDIASEEVAGKQVLLINPPLSFSLMYLPLTAEFNAWSKPESIFALVPASSAFEWQLASDSRVVLRNPSGFQILGDGLPSGDALPTDHFVFMYGRIDRFFSPQPLVAGQELVTDAARVIIAELNAQGDPTELVFEFFRPLTEEHWVVLWWDWQSNGYERLSELPRQWQVPGPFAQ